jgi:2,4-dienoyl-CoA reductase-like NADH-dependent reductase (Old Yellow Enzyme family)
LKIFEPIEIGSVRLKHRLFRSPTWLGAADPSGDVTDALISRYVEYAEGGCALIITGFAFISTAGSLLPGMIGVDNDARIAGLAKLTDAVRTADAEVRIFCQIVHSGRWRLPSVRATYADTFAADETKDPFVQMGGTGETCPAASEERIHDVIGKWAEAAGRCRDAGFDGVELHFGHGFGAAGWFSPLWNHRTDDWGGNLENRSRYGEEVVRAVRNAVGDWPVTARINSEDGVEGGVTHDDMVFFAGRLVKAGVDALDISGGSFGAGGGRLEPSRSVKAGKEGKNGEGYFAEAAARVRAAVGGEGEGKIPVIGVGGWRTPSIMEKHAGSTCDAFAISRPLINESGIVNRWIKAPGYLTDCISCNKCLQGRGIVICRKDAVD